MSLESTNSSKELQLHTLEEIEQNLDTENQGNDLMSPISANGLMSPISANGLMGPISANGLMGPV
ncbi:hypothetical protein A6770_35060 [Nostoc minutum NIES-26]|uniref:Uncharacterized protein n=1 Tax=Nostoc minutum NIES-26 TaxID=1844469 RepID=A0A367S0P6_9NOSO|nr:hypothetical protein A6770_35060 [Nostoc minutum NIES-26]